MVWFGLFCYFTHFPPSIQPFVYDKAIEISPISLFICYCPINWCSFVLHTTQTKPYDQNGHLETVCPNTTNVMQENRMSYLFGRCVKLRYCVDKETTANYRIGLFKWLWCWGTARGHTLLIHSFISFQFFFSATTVTRNVEHLIYSYDLAYITHTHTQRERISVSIFDIVWVSHVKSIRNATHSAEVNCELLNISNRNWEWETYCRNVDSTRETGQ